MQSEESYKKPIIYIDRIYLHSDYIDYPEINSVTKKILTSNYKSGGCQWHKFGDIYVVRTNQAGRLFFLYQKIKSENCLILIDYSPVHDYNKSIIKKPKRVLKYLQQKYTLLLESETVETQDFFEISEKLAENQIDAPVFNKQMNIASTPVYYYNQQFIQLSDEQENAAAASLPTIITGPPGSGKTCIALRLLEKNKHLWENSSKPAVLITESLALCYALKKQWIETLGIDDQRVQFKTYVQLLQEEEFYNTHTLETKQNVIQWINDRKNHLPKEKTSNSLSIVKNNSLAALSAETLYQEFRIITGYSKEEYIKLGKRRTLIDDLAIRQDIWAMYTAYIQYTKDKAHPKYHPPFVHLNPQYHKYSLIVVDEAQDFSLGELYNLYLLSENGSICFCLDSNQDLGDSFSKIPYIKELIFKSTNKSMAPIQLLAGYRCAKAITDVANAILQMKLALTGGVPDKLTNSEIKTQTENPQGEIQFIDPKENIPDNIRQLFAASVEFAVITYAEFKEEACKKFPGAMIFTPEEIKGQEKKGILVYRPFDQPIFNEANAILGSIKFQDQKGKKINRPKQDTGNQNFGHPFNKIFACFTRAISKLWIVQTFSHGNENILEILKSIILFDPSKGREYAEQETNEIEALLSTVEDRLAEAEKQYSKGNHQIAEDIFKNHLSDLNFKEFEKKWNPPSEILLNLYEKQITTLVLEKKWVDLKEHITKKIPFGKRIDINFLALEKEGLTLAWLIAKSGQWDLLQTLMSKVSSSINLNAAPEGDNHADKGVTLAWMLLAQRQYTLFEKLRLNCSSPININAHPLNKSHPDHGFTIAGILAVNEKWVLFEQLCKKKIVDLNAKSITCNHLHRGITVAWLLAFKERWALLQQLSLQCPVDLNHKPLNNNDVNQDFTVAGILAYREKWQLLMELGLKSLSKIDLNAPYLKIEGHYNGITIAWILVNSGQFTLLEKLSPKSFAIDLNIKPNTSPNENNQKTIAWLLAAESQWELLENLSSNSVVDLNAQSLITNRVNTGNITAAGILIIHKKWALLQKLASKNLFPIDLNHVPFSELRSKKDSLALLLLKEKQFLLFFLILEKNLKNQPENLSVTISILVQYEENIAEPFFLEKITENFFSKLDNSLLNQLIHYLSFTNSKFKLYAENYLLKKSEKSKQDNLMIWSEACYQNWRRVKKLILAPETEINPNFTCLDKTDPDFGITLAWYLGKCGKKKLLTLLHEKYHSSIIIDLNAKPSAIGHIEEGITVAWWLAHCDAWELLEALSAITESIDLNAKPLSNSHACQGMKMIWLLMSKEQWILLGQLLLKQSSFIDFNLWPSNRFIQNETLDVQLIEKKQFSLLFLILEINLKNEPFNLAIIISVLSKHGNSIITAVSPNGIHIIENFLSKLSKKFLRQLMHELTSENKFKVYIQKHLTQKTEKLNINNASAIAKIGFISTLQDPHVKLFEQINSLFMSKEAKNYFHSMLTNLKEKKYELAFRQVCNSGESYFKISVEIVKILLEIGLPTTIDFNSQGGESKKTGLHYAALRNNQALCDFLIKEKAADINIPDINGKTVKNIFEERAIAQPILKK